MELMKNINQYLYDWYKSVINKQKDLEEYSDNYQFIWNKLVENPDNIEIIVNFLKDSISDINNQYSFVEDLLYDISEHMTQYSNPLDYFDDISYGGCASGLVGMFIYNSDCKNFYIKYIDDIEDFMDDYLDYLEPIAGLRRYTWCC